MYHKRFPNDRVIIGDAYEYIPNHYDEYDLTWASPECPTHSTMMSLQKRKSLPDLRLYSLIIFLRTWSKKYWIIENVISYYKPLIKPTCQVDRHYIWSNLTITEKRFRRPKGGFMNIKDFGVLKLSKYLGINADILHGIPSKEKVKILRNCVLPEAGKYILDCIVKQNQSSLEQFIEG